MTTAPSHTPHWTARQREVLDLLARGYTNPQIAERLSISLDGAKWHVSEVITRLGVDTREEAADYWRAENGLRRRLFRMVRAAWPVLAFGRVAFAAVAVAAIGAGAVLAVLSLRGGDGLAHADVTPPATVATPTGIARASVTPASTVSPSAPVSLPSAVAGNPVVALVPGSPMRFPDNTVLYLAQSSCFACGFGPGDLWRIYRSHEGQLVADHVMPTGAQAYTFSPDGGTVIAYVCDGYCGGESNPSETAVGHFVMSHDGGITWQPLGDKTFSRSYASFSGWANGEAVATVIAYLPSNSAGEARSYLLPSFTELVPPAGVPAATPGKWDFPTPFVGPSGEIRWQSYQGGAEAFDANGKAAGFDGLARLVPGREWRNQTFGEVGHEGIQSVWFPISVGKDPPVPFFVEVDSNGRAVGGFSTAVGDVTFGALLDTHMWLGAAVVPVTPGQTAVSGGTENVHAVLIDGYTGLIHPIDGLPGYEDSPIPGNFSFPRFALAGDYWRVDAGPDCLNVREAAATSSVSLGCFASGVLLRQRGDVSAPDSWKAVWTPDGNMGFAASEYLK